MAESTITESLLTDKKEGFLFTPWDHDRIVYFGNSGLRFVLFHNLPWEMHFRPESADPIDRHDIYTNGLLFVRAIYTAAKWFEDKGSDIKPDAFIRQLTNLRMNAFRKRVFESLTEATGVPEIYYEIERRSGGAVIGYELRLDRLTQAIKKAEETIPKKERLKIRFFQLLEKSKQLEL